MKKLALSRAKSKQSTTGTNKAPVLLPRQIFAKKLELLIHLAPSYARQAKEHGFASNSGGRNLASAVQRAKNYF